MIWETLLLGLHVVVAAALIGFVLLQHGKGADMGAAFGSGSSGTAPAVQSPAPAPVKDSTSKAGDVPK
jgi:protein translocase SecG subunit